MMKAEPRLAGGGDASIWDEILGGDDLDAPWDEPVVYDTQDDDLGARVQYGVEKRAGKDQCRVPSGNGRFSGRFAPCEGMALNLPGAKAGTREHITLGALATRDHEGKAIRVRKVAGGAFDGTPVALTSRNTLTKAQTGMIGEAVAAQVLGRGTFGLNTKRNNFPVDLVRSDALIEVKAGLATNGTSAQKWRVTLGEPGKGAKEWLKSASPEKKRKYNAAKMKMAIQRKNAIVGDLSRQVGKSIKGQTVSVILDHARRRAYVYRFQGFHERIGWTSDKARAAFVGQYAY